jgi:hypothetical protein
MTPYYYVYNSSGARPSYRHKSLESAVAEAERLAAQHPAVTFEVLQCVALSSTPKPKASTFFLDAPVTNKSITNKEESNNIPSHLPPLPPVPSGYSRWEYRGIAWQAGKATRFAICDNDSDFWARYSGCTIGNPYFHYIEAV